MSDYKFEWRKVETKNHEGHSGFIVEVLDGDKFIPTGEWQRRGTSNRDARMAIETTYARYVKLAKRPV